MLTLRSLRGNDHALATVSSTFTAATYIHMTTFSRTAKLNYAGLQPGASRSLTQYFGDGRVETFTTLSRLEESMRARIASGAEHVHQLPATERTSNSPDRLSMIDLSRIETCAPAVKPGGSGAESVCSCKVQEAYGGIKSSASDLDLAAFLAREKPCKESSKLHAHELSKTKTRSQYILEDLAHAAYKVRESLNHRKMALEKCTISWHTKQWPGKSHEE